MRPLALRSFAALMLGLLVLYACQDTSEVTRPSSAVAATYRLTVSGLGNGNGVVTSSPAGINCTITGGVAATSGCTKLFSSGVTVTLTAKPAAGHALAAWGKQCSGTGPCVVKMSTARAVSAEFRKGPFTIKISGDATGVGSGRVTSQTGLVPAINCVITNGTPAATGCSAKYPAYTVLTLTATPSDGFVFDGWADKSCGTGSCQFTAVKNRTIPACLLLRAAGTRCLRHRW